MYYLEKNKKNSKNKTFLRKLDRGENREAGDWRPKTGR